MCCFRGFLWVRQFWPFPTKECDLFPVIMGSMRGIGLFEQGWIWVQYQKQLSLDVRVAAYCLREKLGLLIDRHWPLFYSWCTIAGRFLFRMLCQWSNCVVGGLRSLFTLGSAAIFVIMWSCLLCSTSTTSLFYVLLSLVCSNYPYYIYALQRLLSAVISQFSLTSLDKMWSCNMVHFCLFDWDNFDYLSFFSYLVHNYF